MGIQFPISPLHGAQYTPPGIPVTWQYDIARSAWRVVRGGTAWTDITGKPATFPPSAHNHLIADITNLQSILDVKQDITARGQPSGYAALDTTGKVPAAQLPDALGVDWTSVANKPTLFPPTPHTHPVVEISDSTSVGQQLVRSPSAFAARSVIGAIGIDDNARVSVKLNGTVVGVRRGLNFVPGLNTTLSVTDDVTNEDVDVTINSIGGSGGSAVFVTEVKPVAPADNAMWLDTATGLLLIYYNDGTNRQWVEPIPYVQGMPAGYTKFTFPTAPADGQLYNPNPGTTWIWSSVRGIWFAAPVSSLSYTKAESDAKFVDTAGDTMTGALTLSADPTANLQAATKQYVDNKASVYVQDTPPAGAPDKSLWWESDSGNLYVRYNDGSSSQWVIAMPQPDATLFVSKTGDTMTGPLVLPGNPTTNLQAAPKQYVDSQDSQVTAQIGNKVDKAGDTMTGPLTLAAASPGLTLNKAITGVNYLIGQSGGKNRWNVVLGDNTAESGSNAGSNFLIQNCNDAGAAINNALSINRATGGTTLTGPLTVGGLFTASGQANISGGVYGSGTIDAAGSLVSRGGTFSWSTFYLCNSGGGAIGQIYINNGGMYFQNIQGVNTYLNLDQGNLFNWVGSQYACKSGGGAWSDFSDIRIKNITGDYTRGLDDVVKLHPINYVFKGNDTKRPPSNAMTPDQEGKADLGVAAVPYPNSHHYNAAKNADELTGLIAQEVQEIFPEMVKEHAGFIDGEPVTDLLHLDTTPLIFALINSVKELKARVEALEAGSA